MGILSPNTALIVAMKAEFDADVLKPPHLLTFCGIGKVNAAITAARVISERKPDLVLNLGTAGSNKFNYGEVVNVTRFIQRDMDLTMFGREKYFTPGDESAVLKYGMRLPQFPESIIGTGDHFATSIPDDYELADMESYAIAKACASAGVKFLCLKFITDGANEKAPEDFIRVLEAANAKLREVYESLT
jgi:adenosylhomocysteine nucleosidase